MSDLITCVLHGTCSEISEKNGWTAFSIDIGRQYPVKLQTKKDDVIAMARAIGIGQATWTYLFGLGGENPHRPGTHYKNRYLESALPGLVRAQVAEPDLEEGSTPSTVPVGGTPGGGSEMTNADWEQKERRRIMSFAWAHTMTANQHTFRSDETPEQQFARLQAYQRKVYNDICGEFAFPADGRDLPTALQPEPTAVVVSAEPPPDDDIPF